MIARGEAQRSRSRAVAWLAAWMVALACGSWAVADVAPEAIAAGDTGVALTAGPGNVIESFPITVLGVLEDAGAGFPLILIRAEGAFIERSGGVAAGMSGSPVYVDVGGVRDLLGAIGFVFPESDHQLALVTPIAAMRRVTDGAAAGPVHVAGLGQARPVGTPILLGGVGRRGAGLLAPLFDTATTLVPVQAGGAGAQDGAYVLEPGSAISVQLVRGDVTIGAIGTVTTLEGDRVLAFGHPLLGTGPTSLPFAPAYVTAIIGSTVVPFKLANSGARVLGEIHQDRPAAIAGSTADTPDLLPVRIVLGGDGRGRSLAYEVVRDERLFPTLVAVGALEAIDRALQAVGGGTATIAWEIVLADGPPIRMLDEVADPDDLATVAALAIGAPLQLLARNPFEPPGIDRVSLNVELTRNRDVGEIVEVRSELDVVEAGGEVTVHVRLQPYRGEAIVETFLLQLPGDLAERVDGDATLRLRGGRVPTGEDPDDGEPPLLSFAELVAALESRPRGNELVVELITVDGPERLDRRAFPFVVLGSEEVSLEVATGDEDEPDADGAGTDEPNADDAAADDAAGGGAVGDGPSGGGGDDDERP